MHALTALAATILRVHAAPAGGVGSADVDDALRTYLRQAVHAAGQISFRAVDLNLDGDGVPEVIAYVEGPGLCGTGGCDTFILKRSGNGYRTVTKMIVTHLPIRVLASRSHGWSDLGVTVVGGGVLTAYEAQLRFDGRSYPSNPTVPPAEPLARTTGRLLIASSTEQ